MRDTEESVGSYPDYAREVKKLRSRRSMEQKHYAHEQVRSGDPCCASEECVQEVQRIIEETVKFLRSKVS